MLFSPPTVRKRINPVSRIYIRGITFFRLWKGFYPGHLYCSHGNPENNVSQCCPKCLWSRVWFFHFILFFVFSGGETYYFVKCIFNKLLNELWVCRYKVKVIIGYSLCFLQGSNSAGTEKNKVTNQVEPVGKHYWFPWRYSKKKKKGGCI